MVGIKKMVLESVKYILLTILVEKSTDHCSRLGLTSRRRSSGSIHKCVKIVGHVIVDDIG